MQLMSDKIDQIAKAIGNVQQVIDIVKKDAKGNNYTYADLTSVQNAVVKPFKANGLSYSHVLDGDNVICILFHESGQYLTSRYPIEAQATKFMNINQSRGSAITYGRRYTLAAIVGIPQDDDDAKGSNFNESEKQEEQEKAKKELAEKMVSRMLGEISFFTDTAHYTAFIAKYSKYLQALHDRQPDLFKSVVKDLNKKIKELNVNPELIWIPNNNK